MMKIGRSSISVNVPTPYTRVCQAAVCSRACEFDEQRAGAKSQTCGRSGAKSSRSSVAGGIKTDGPPKQKGGGVLF